MVVFRRSTDGRWVARVTRAGRRRDFYGSTRAEARAKAEAFLRDLGGRPLPQPGQRTLQDVFQAFLETADLRPRTRADYEAVVRRYLQPLMDRRLASIEALDLLHVLQPLRNRPRTAQLAFRVVHRVLGFAARCGYLADNPADRVEVPRYQARRRAVWTASELRAFLRAAEDHPLGPLFLLLAGTGLRWSEAAGLAWKDLDLEAGLVRVERSLHRVRGQWATTPPKTASGARTISLPAQVVQALRRHRLRALEAALREGRPWSEEDLVFCSASGTPLHHRRALEALRKVCRRAGVPEVGLHGLRHQHTSLLIAQGVPLPDVARRLGHASPAITASVYSHALGEDRKAAEVLEMVLTKGRR
jgi:integrase